MIKIRDEKQCCGCGACIASCPRQCITFKEGTLGARFPVVNEALCINCGLCEKVCPIIQKPERKIFRQEAFAAYAKDRNIRFSGSSGGISGLLGRGIIEKGGVVFGAGFDDGLQLKCMSAGNYDELKRLYKSKYLESDLTEAYSQIKNALQRKKPVLFVSAPCQVAALKKYLKTEYKNLITVDFFCHGVPSQKFFDECLEYENKKNGYVTENFEFRTKVRNGSTPHYFTRWYRKHGKLYSKTRLYFDSVFYAAFQQYICLRESCYACKFNGRDRISDITLGDFHDIDKYVDGINRFDGVSTVIINSDKGERLFESIADQCNLIPFDTEKLIADKTIFSGPTVRPNKRDAFVRCYEEHGIAGLERHYLSPKYYLKNRLYYHMPGILRNKIKRLMK